ncbi:MAG: methyltransferase domain-containing protein, partial [Candidatus Bathyarchaeia archaeon]
MTATSSCCERSKSPNQGEGVKEYIRETYAELAKSPREGSCCFAAKRAGYSEDQLAALPESARAIAAGCGNPTALAGLKPGEVVLDLGSGGGIDVLLAAKLVGPEGRAIGVDITPEMVAKARE